MAKVITSPARQSETLAALAAGHGSLQTEPTCNAPPQQDKAHRARISEKMNVERVPRPQRVICGKGGQGNAAHHDGVQHKQAARNFLVLLLFSFIWAS